MGKVAYAEENGGLGIAFTKIESNHQLVLEKWIAETEGHARSGAEVGKQASQELRVQGHEVGFHFIQPLPSLPPSRLYPLKSSKTSNAEPNRLTLHTALLHCVGY